MMATAQAKENIIPNPDAKIHTQLALSNAENINTKKRILPSPQQIPESN
jgi:hypothetical protein